MSEPYSRLLSAMESVSDQTSGNIARAYDRFVGLTLAVILGSLALLLVVGVVVAVLSLVERMARRSRTRGAGAGRKWEARGIPQGPRLTSGGPQRVRVARAPR